jgi:hypothetical protein
MGKSFGPMLSPMAVSGSRKVAKRYMLLMIIAISPEISFLVTAFSSFKTWRGYEDPLQVDALFEFTV